MSIHSPFAPSHSPSLAHGPTGHQFSPYTSNGGTILAIAGKNFCVIAGDTRQSEGYNIQTRYKPKVHRLTDKAVLATNGFAADADALVRRIRQRIIWYRHTHGKDMAIHAIARMIQTLLYGKRFFPYYVYNILGGVDEEGVGAVYSFDPVGSYEREFCRAAGSAQSLVQPFLDSMIMHKNQQPLPGSPLPTPGEMPLSEVLSIVTDSFTSATERHIEVGDGLEMYVVRDVKTLKGAGPVGVVDAGLHVEGAETLAVGGEGKDDEEGDPEAVVVIRRELKKD